MTDKSSYTSQFKSSLLSGLSSASSTASSGLSSASSLVTNTASSATTLVANTATLASTTAVGAVGKFKDGEEFDSGQLIEELGMNSIRVQERDKIYKLFEKIGVKQGADKHSPVGINLEMFVKSMVIERFNVQWSDAAFRAIDFYSKRGYLNKEDFLLAYVSLKTTKPNMENTAWVKLRRKVLFIYYNKGSNESLNFLEFNELLNDISNCNDEPVPILIILAYP